MKRRAWGPQDDALLRDLYPRKRTSELPQLLGRSYSAIHNRVAAMHLKKLPEASMRRRWTRAEDKLLRALYPISSMPELTERLKREPCSVYNRAVKLRLFKSEEYLASPEACRLRRGDNVGAKYRFPKGHVPANKGVRRPGFSVGRMNETQFKKGQPGHNWKPIGTERLVDGYRYTKVSDIRNVPWTKNWIATHILLWEKHHGPLNRRTHALRFKNRDRSDVRLDNLELTSRRENMLRNTIHNLPKPLVETIQLLGALKRKINRRSRHEEQDRRPA